MERLLLTTKLYVPPPRPNLVPRSGLLERLNAGLRLGRRLTLVSAPAGFGKTTLISEWVSASERTIAWISLDEGDNDPVQFLRYLIAALQQLDEGIGRTVLQALQSPQVPPPQSLITPLINDVVATEEAVTLVLDDYQLITASAVHRIVQSLLANQPPTLHLAISTREDPPLPLPRLRARGQVSELRERDLRFTPDEAAAFLNQTMRLSLSPEAVEALAGRTEGWVAGLQLAALALQQQTDATRAQAFIAAFSGDDRYVVDYLISEVLQRQPEAVRTFLRQTAILERLSAPLCDAVTGRDDSREMLERLEAANLFLIHLDRRREWYRYHRFFAEVLRSTLDDVEKIVLHQRAATWYESHGHASFAIGHALAYGAASGELGAAERLIGQIAEETFQSGSIMTVRAWLEALPDERVRANAELATYNGWVSVLTGELDLAEGYARAVEQAQNHKDDQQPGRLLLLRCYIALGHRDYEDVTRLATAALRVLKEEQPQWRIMAFWALAEAQERTGNMAEAITTLREARRAGYALGNQISAAMVELSLASALNNHARRREAVAVCEQAIARLTDKDGQPSPAAAMVLSRLGMLYYEANALELARQQHEKALTLAGKTGVSGLVALSNGLAAVTFHAQGQTAEALRLLEKADQLAAQDSLSDAAWLSATQVNIYLQEEDVASAARWAERMGYAPDDRPHYLRIESHLTYARLLLAQGQLPDARRWLARLERFARERNLNRWLLTVHILQALVAARSGDGSVAHERLSNAVALAAPEDYYRAFLDEGDQVIGLLPGVRVVAPAFVDQLLVYSGPRRTEQVVVQPLIEPLSARELEVLGLVAAGLSNREIAQELVIALGTVKRHINNIYGKLAVRRRTEAVARARHIGIL